MFSDECKSEDQIVGSQTFPVSKWRALAEGFQGRNFQGQI